MKNKASIILGIIIIVFPILIIVFTVSDMSSSPSVEINDEFIKLKAPLCAGENIKYTDINSIEYIDKFEFGEKRKGNTYEDFVAGLYRNEIFGNYYIVASRTCDKYIKIECKNRLYILNFETLKQTNNRYTFICQKIKSISSKS